MTQGAAGIETDVRVSRDGVPFLLHDQTLARTTDAANHGLEAANAESVTWADLRDLDAGSWFASEYSDQRLVPLADLPTVVGDGVIDLELKLPTDHHPEQVIAAVADQLQSVRWADAVRGGRVVVTSFDPDLVDLARDLPVPVGFLCESVPEHSDLLELADLGVTIVLPQSIAIHPDGAARIHASGLELWTWTVNDAAEAQRLADLGVSAMCSDTPATLIDAFTSGDTPER